MTTYDIFQKAFTVSMAVNANFNKTGTPAALELTIDEALGYLEATHPLVFGGWTVQWGPVVWQAPGSNGPDQTMAVVRSADASTYVVAIAGTQESSVYDMITEDLSVLPYQMVAWPGVAGAKVSAGTWQGVQNLLSMPNAKGVVLKDFLASVADGGKSVVFTGHSLGGALAPALAFTLYPSGSSGSGWANVWTMPTAGPSTGNPAWFAAFANAFPKISDGDNPWSNWNCNVVNFIDVVPKAWTRLSCLPILYQGVAADVAADLTAVAGLMQAMAADSNGNAYGSFANVTAFTGTQQTDPLTTFEQVAEEALYQHTKAYVGFFGIEGLLPKAAGTTASGILSLI